MEKDKKSMKYRILAGFLAFVLANSSISLAIGESKYNNKVIKAKIVKSVKDIDLDAYSNYFAEPDYSGDYDENALHVHAYVDDDGNFVKWLPCEKLTVDGLHWTERKESWTNEQVIAAIKNDEWGINEPHATLYYNNIQKCMIPFYPEDVPEDESWQKFFGIRFLSREKCRMLMEIGLQRVVDNLDLVIPTNDLIQNGSNKFQYKDTANNLLFLNPISIDDKKIICENILVKEGKIDYDYISSMLLYRSVIMVFDKNVETYSTKARYVQIPRVPSFQTSIIVAPVKEIYK